jgi:hypothetical protein
MYVELSLAPIVAVALNRKAEGDSINRAPAPWPQTEVGFEKMR